MGLLIPILEVQKQYISIDKQKIYVHMEYNIVIDIDFESDISYQRRNTTQIISTEDIYAIGKIA